MICKEVTTASSRITKIGGGYPTSQSMSHIKRCYLFASPVKIMFWALTPLHKIGAIYQIEDNDSELNTGKHTRKLTCSS